MQTRISTEDALSCRRFAATARLAMPQDAFENGYQPRRGLGVVDGLVSTTQRAWRLHAETGERDAAAGTKL